MASMCVFVWVACWHTGVSLPTCSACGPLAVPESSPVPHGTATPALGSTSHDGAPAGVWVSPVVPALAFKWLRSYAVRDEVLLSAGDLRALVDAEDAGALLALLKPEVAAVL